MQDMLKQENTDSAVSGKKTESGKTRNSEKKRACSVFEQALFVWG